MATNPTDQFTQFLKITYDTEDNNWGNICNTNFEVIARAIAGFVEVNCTGSSDINLSATEFSNQSIKLTGLLAANINVIVPTYERSFTIWNACTGDFTVTVKTAAGTGVAMPSNGVSPIWPMLCDGTNVVIGMKILDGNTFGVYRNFQSTGINDAALSTLMTLTAGGRIVWASGTLHDLANGALEWVRTSSSDIDHMHWVAATGLLYVIDGGTSKTTDETKLGGIVVDQVQILNEGTLTVEGAATIGTTLDVTGAVTFGAALDVAGNVTIDGDLAIVGTISGGGLGTAAFSDDDDFSAASHSHAEASPSAAGYMSASDKLKLDNLPGLLLHCRDEKTAGTDGGTFVNDNAYGRVVDDVEVNDIVGASVSVDEITLPAGTYEIMASAPAFNVDSHRAFLYNETDATAIIFGTTERTNADVMTRSLIVGRFVLTGTKVVKILHRCQTTNADDGRGKAANLAGQIEVYTEVLIRKLP